MVKTEINPLIMVIVGVVLVGLVVFIGFRAAQPPQPPVGSYKPGVPPWLDPDNPDHGKIQAPPVARPDARDFAGTGTTAAASHP